MRAFDKNISNKQKKSKFIFCFGKVNMLILFLLTSIFGFSCTDNNFDNLQKCLDISLYMKVKTSRGVIEGATLPQESAIGVTLQEADKATYDGSSFQNMKYWATVENGQQKWETNKTVFLSNTKGMVYAYYPYNINVDNFTEIPVVAGITDYMYAVPAIVYGQNNKAILQMKHAMTGVRLDIIRDTYSKTGFIEKVSIQSGTFATGAMMDATTGDLWQIEGANVLFPMTVEKNLQTSPSIDMIMVPTGVEDKITFLVRIDGVDYEVNTAIPLLAERGCIYKYILSVQDEKLTLGKMKVFGFGEEDEEDLDFNDDNTI